MQIGIILTIILFISFFMALWSMRDFEMPKEVRKLMKFKKVAGTILFLSGKITHYKRDKKG